MSLFDRLIRKKKPSPSASYTLTRKGESGLSDSQRSDPDTAVLTALMITGSHSPESLRRATSLSPDQISRSLDRLEKRGLISSVSPRDED